MAFGDSNKSDNTKGERTRGALRFIFHPELGRSTKPLGQTFQMFVQLIAMMFVTNGVLDRTHRFFQPGAQFTLGDVFNETYARFDWRDKAKLPQTIFFIAVWGMLAMVTVWSAAIVFGFILGVKPAHAEAATGMFTPHENDLGVKYIDNLFFGTALGSSDAVALIQNAFRSMLAMFSRAMLVFGSFILLYHIVNMIVKAAWEGKALQGAGEIWTPLRLVLAIGMLVPISQDLNAAQHVVIKIGKMGSALASTAWTNFEDALNQNVDDVIGDVTNADQISPIFKNMIMIHACKEDVNRKLQETSRGLAFNTPFNCADVAAVDATLATATAIGGIASGGAGAGVVAVGATALDMLFHNGVNMGECIARRAPLTAVLAGAAMQAGSGGNAETDDVRQYGERYNNDLCGEIKWPMTNETSSGARGAMRTTVRNLVKEQATILESKAIQIAHAMVNTCYDNAGAETDNESKPCDITGASVSETFRAGVVNDAGRAVSAYVTAVNAGSKEAVRTFIAAINQENQQAQASTDYGWATAGAYFMRLAGIQGAISSILEIKPAARRGPMFNRVKRTQEQNDDVIGRLLGDVAGGFNVPVPFAKTHQEPFVENKPAYVGLLGYTGANVGAGAAFTGQGENSTPSSDSLWSKIGDALGLTMDKAFFIDMIAPAGGDPFTTLFKAGQTMYHIVIALIVGGVIAFTVPLNMGMGAGSVMFGLAMYLFVPAVLLAFILPIIPATRFLIGVFSWLGALFEAVVGMPMLALAHLTPGGDSLIAPAKDKYHWLFSIMLKPLFIVFGLIAAVLLSTIGIHILNSMFVTALDVMWGEGNVFILTALIFAGVYAFQAYGVCNTCFKVMDEVPDRIYQWFGSGYQMKDYDDDYLGGGKIAAGAVLFKGVADQMSGGLKSIAQGRANKKSKAAEAVSKKERADLEETRHNQMLAALGGGGAGGGAPGGGATGGGTPGGGGAPAPAPIPKAPGPLGRGAARVGGAIGGMAGRVGGAMASPVNQRATAIGRNMDNVAAPREAARAAADGHWNTAQSARAEYKDLRQKMQAEPNEAARNNLKVQMADAKQRAEDAERDFKNTRPKATDGAVENAKAVIDGIIKPGN